MIEFAKNRLNKTTKNGRLKFWGPRFLYKTGGINIIDLANIYSCPFIATEDLGKKFDDETFAVLGRFNNSDLRGCNLLLQ